MVAVTTSVFLIGILFGLGALMNAVLETEYNRMVIYKEPMSDKVLPGHVIRTEQVPDEGSCRVKCYLEPNCLSINVGPSDEGKHACELNNATEGSTSETALEKRQGYIHYAVENVCISNPCPGKNTLCQVGFTNNGYRCVCRQGYQGNLCSEDIDECKLGLHNCKLDRECVNEHGSFHCNNCRSPLVKYCTNCKECHEALGVERGAISDAQISASSEWDANHAAIQGRLHFQATGNKQGAWSAKINDANQWLQIDLRSRHNRVTGVATQGRNGHGQWVTRYKVQYGDDGVNFQYYREHGQNMNKEFEGNSDRDTVVRHNLNPPITARYIRFRPTVWREHISIRVELYGCYEYFTTTGSLSGNCYMLFTKEETWSTAQKKCKTLGADLVKIESAEENEFVETTFLAPYASSGVAYWIGLSDQENEGEWKWTDGSLLSGNSNWKVGSPNNSGDCVWIAMGHLQLESSNYTFDAEWNDWACGALFGYICKKVSP